MATTPDIKVAVDLEELTEHVRQIVHNALDEHLRESTVELAVELAADPPSVWTTTDRSVPANAPISNPSTPADFVPSIPGEFPTPTSPERFGPWVSGARLTEAETRAAAESTSEHYGVALACKAFIDGELWTDANGKLLKSAPTQQVEESTTHVKEPDKRRLYGQDGDENLFFEIEGWLDDNADWLEDMKPVDLILLEHEVADPRSHFPGAESMVEMMMDYAYNWGEVTEVVEWDKENTQVLAAAEAFAQAITDTQTGRMAGKVVARHRWNGNGFEKVDDND